MSALRPLPPRPSLEFERKEAKALHRRLRVGDVDALARARERHPVIDVSQPARIKLADAQLVIAREYGFVSWPRLVRYFQSAEQSEVEHTLFLPQQWDGRVRGFMVEHRDRRVWAGRALAAYVPRFYGWPLDDIFASPITEDDARLAIARQWGCLSWEVLLERSRQSRRSHCETAAGPLASCCDATAATPRSSSLTWSSATLRCRSDRSHAVTSARVEEPYDQETATEAIGAVARHCPPAPRLR